MKGLKACMFMNEELERKRKEFIRKKNEMEKKLAEEFSFMRRGDSYKKQQEVNGRTYDLFGAYGCNIGNGWYEVLRGLCNEITAVYERAGKPIDIVCDQVKEKFGKLRFYYHHEGHYTGIQAIDVLGGPSLRARHGNSELHSEINNIVHKWEAQSGCVCERCGAPGELRNDIGYRVQTLCNSCHMQIKNKNDEREMKRKE